MGSYYQHCISDRDPVDEMYDWPITGIPGEYVYGEDCYMSDDYAEERWKQTSIPHLWVSDYGQFYNDESKRFIKPTHGDGQGHKAVKVTVGGKRYQAYAHRLLAEAFIDNVYNEPNVRHLNDVPDDNDLDNLAWGTQLENHLDSVRNGNHKPVTDAARRKGIDITRHPVKAINKSTGEELYFESQGEAGRKLGIPQANIWKVINGERHSAGNYFFEEIEKEACYEQVQ